MSRKLYEQSRRPRMSLALSLLRALWREADALSPREDLDKGVMRNLSRFRFRAHCLKVESCKWLGGSRAKPPRRPLVCPFFKDYTDKIYKTCREEG
eukprot:1161868-Pelagomonas_calceolata.AAC.19